MKLLTHVLLVRMRQHFDVFGYRECVIELPCWFGRGIVLNIWPYKSAVGKSGFVIDQLVVAGDGNMDRDACRRCRSVPLTLLSTLTCTRVTGLLGSSCCGSLPPSSSWSGSEVSNP